MIIFRIHENTSKNLQQAFSGVVRILLFYWYCLFHPEFALSAVKYERRGYVLTCYGSQGELNVGKYWYLLQGMEIMHLHTLSSISANFPNPRRKNHPGTSHSGSRNEKWFVFWPFFYLEELVYDALQIWRMIGLTTVRSVTIIHQEVRCNSLV